MSSHYYTVGEMYCGPGGLGLGTNKASLKTDNLTYKFKHTWALDCHQDSCLTFQNNVVNNSPDCDIICSDVRDINITKLPYVDGFLYGFPCNDFSNISKRKGLNGKYGSLYSYGVEYIAHHNPKFFLAENVSGLSSANSGEALAKILNELSTAGLYGYNLTTHLYKFEHYGVPQARHRYIIIGIRNDINLDFKVPKPTKKTISAKSAIEDPPIPHSAPNQEATKQSKQVINRLKHIKAGENAWSANLPNHLRLNVKAAKLSIIYKRLDPDKPAYTVTGSGGGGTHMYHWKEHRALTNRERARLQTFPDSFHFCGNKESVRMQIGMAVPVKGAQVIMEAVLKTLTSTPYPYIGPSAQNLDLQQLNLLSGSGAETSVEWSKAS